MGTTTRPSAHRVLVTSLEVREAPSVEGCPETAYGATLRTSRRTAEILRPILEGLPTEEFWALALDGRHRLVAPFRVSVGTLTTSIVHPREVYGPAFRYGCAAVIVAHNHPSGDPEPSREDLAVTRRLIRAGAVLGVPLLDHIVTGEGSSYVAIRERLDFAKEEVADGR